MVSQVLHQINDPFSHHNGWKFRTFDNNNDGWTKTVQ